MMSSSNQRPAKRGFRSGLRCAMPPLSQNSLRYLHQNPSSRLFQRISGSRLAEGKHSDRDTDIQRRRFQIVSLAVTLSASLSDADGGLNSNSPWTPQPFRISDIGRSSMTENINEIAPEEREAE